MARNFQHLGRLLWISLNRSSSTSGFVERRLLLQSSSSAAAAWQGFQCNSASFRCYSQNNAPVRSDQHQQDDRIRMFIDPNVQTLLKELTGRDLKRIFRKRKIGQKLREPKYSFMTEEQLQQARQEAEYTADKLLQMPPVLRPRKPIDEVLSFDPCIQGEESSTLIFTDITMNIADRDRIIVARDPDGTLRQATCEERDKANAIYFPVPGREFVTPKMFTEPGVLQNVLNRASETDNTYEFVLDRACLQFEPDDPLYCSAVEATYEAIEQRGHYDFLKSTRYFGPMVFYLVRMRKLDNILLHSLKHGRMSDASRLVKLFQIMFPECKSVTTDNISEPEQISRYIHLDAIKKGELELALNAYLEEEERKAELEDGLKHQHGLISS